MNNCLPDAALPFSHALFQLSHFLEGSRALVRRGPAGEPDEQHSLPQVTTSYALVPAHHSPTCRCPPMRVR